MVGQGCVQRAKGKLCSMILPSASLLSWLLGLAAAAAYAVPALAASRLQAAGAALLLLAYVGSRFVLEVVLGRSA